MILFAAVGIGIIGFFVYNNAPVITATVAETFVKRIFCFSLRINCKTFRIM